MGVSYLDGKRWADVTREERFFCQHLFTLAVKDPAYLLSCIEDHEGNRLPIDIQWEPALRGMLLSRSISLHALETSTPFAQTRISIEPHF